MIDRRAPMMVAWAMTARRIFRRLLKSATSWMEMATRRSGDGAPGVFFILVDLHDLVDSQNFKRFVDLVGKIHHPEESLGLDFAQDHHKDADARAGNEIETGAIHQNLFLALADRRHRLFFKQRRGLGVDGSKEFDDGDVWLPGRRPDLHFE